MACIGTGEQEVVRVPMSSKTHERAAAWEVDAGMGFEACQDPLIGSLGRKSGAIVPAKFARAQNSAPRYFVPASSNHDHVYAFMIDSKGS
jgi:hypothetical protein